MLTLSRMMRLCVPIIFGVCALGFTPPGAAGDQPDAKRVSPAPLDWSAGEEAAAVVGRLPRLVDLRPDGTDIRCTAWQRGAQCSQLLMNLGSKPVDVTIDGKPSVLVPGEVSVLSAEPSTNRLKSFPE